MSQCLNPECLEVNTENREFCFQCGTKIKLCDRYKPVKILGKGSFGRTFLAIDEQKPSKPYCVIKQFLPNVKTKKGLNKALELFEREAIRLDELGRHSQIPALLAFFNQEERQYLIQEFIDGYDLAKELRLKGVFQELQIKELLRDMLTVLKFVHTNKVIHRDIKPENIIRRKQDNKLVLVDFGAAKNIEGNDALRTGTIIGSAAYIAPEQAAGKPQFASDLYSLGTTCLHLLTNVEPTQLFDLSEGEWMWRDYLKDNEIGYELSRVLDKLVEGATKKRFQNVDEVLAALAKNQQRIPQLTLPSDPVSERSVKRISQAAKYGVKTYQRSPISPSKKQRKQPSRNKLKFQIAEYTYVTFKGDRSRSHQQYYQPQAIRNEGKAKYVSFDLGREISLDLIGIPGGKFIMGSPADELERDYNESPQHSVTVRPFLLGKHPITQGQWSVIMEDNPARFADRPNYPVEKVSWFDCLEFCQRLSKRLGREFRLPTEAEWEYACRGKQTTATPFHFGNTITTELANYNGEFTYANGEEGESRNQTTKVANFSPNSLGLYDLHGNVAEWCQDNWHDNYENAPQDGTAWDDNRNFNNRTPRILRGGSWLQIPSCCRSASRLKAEPKTKSDAFGFRIALSV